MDIEGIIKQVKYNCNVSDARFWGYYSICGLLLRMRELYRQEKGLMPWERIQPDDISFWIEEREALWRELEGKDFRSLDICGRTINPFDVEAINKLLNGRGLLYGGGYSIFWKPTFFLARLKDKRQIYDYNVYYADEELCRDLSTSVAMLQGVCIFTRMEQIRLTLWEKIEEMRSRKFAGLPDRAFSLYDIKKDSPLQSTLYERVRIIAEDISDIFLFHEIGEAIEGEYDRWQDLQVKDRWLEIHLRGIKDLLADTSDYGPLNFIIEKRDERLLLFYLLFLSGIRKTLFPEMMNYFQAFIDSGDWNLLKKVRMGGYERAKSIMEEIRAIISVKEDLSEVTGLVKKAIEKGLNIKS